MSLQHTDHVDVALIGAGPHALTCAAFLRHVDPALRIVAVDPSGSWLTTWRRQMARQDIDVLRSAGVHHPHPDPMALIDRAGRGDLVGDYNSPTVAAFDRLCREVVATCHLEDAVLAGQVVELDPDRKRPRLRLSSGRELTARHVIAASNTRTPTWPEWAQRVARAPGALPDQLRHARHVDLGAHSALRSSVVVIGGGLSSVQYARGAHERGAHVTLVARRTLEERTFDVDPGWLGPKYLADFDAETSWERRAETVVAARGGGTVPARWLDEIRGIAARSSRLEIVEGDIVTSATVEPLRWRLRLGSGRVLDTNEVWLATGSVATVERGLYRAMVMRLPVPTAGGLPALDHQLRWGGAPVHLVGSAAALVLGPAAGNLAGARAGAERVTAAITGCWPET